MSQECLAKELELPTFLLIVVTAYVMFFILIPVCVWVKKSLGTCMWFRFVTTHIQPQQCKSFENYSKKKKKKNESHFDYLLKNVFTTEINVSQ